MVKTYIFLIAAIFCEVAGTMLLPLSQNFTKIIPITIKNNPNTACQAKVCLKNIYPRIAIVKIPSPLHVAYTIAIGSLLTTKVNK